MPLQTLQLLLQACQNPEELDLLKMLLRLDFKTGIKANGVRAQTLACHFVQEYSNLDSASTLLKLSRRLSCFS